MKTRIVALFLSLAMLLASGVVYNIPPLRMKDRAWWDVIAESFNNPIRLWLGWFALATRNCQQQCNGLFESDLLTPPLCKLV